MALGAVGIASAMVAAWQRRKRIDEVGSLGSIAERAYGRQRAEWWDRAKFAMVMAAFPLCVVVGFGASELTSARDESKFEAEVVRQVLDQGGLVPGASLGEVLGYHPWVHSDASCSRYRDRRPGEGIMHPDMDEGPLSCTMSTLTFRLPDGEPITLQVHQSAAGWTVSSGDPASRARLRALGPE